MIHKPLSEILSALHQQQVQELSLIKFEAEKKNKQELYKITIFFIEKSWLLIEKDLLTPTFGLTFEQSPEELRIYLKELKTRNPAFAWGWLRARMNERLLSLVAEALPSMLNQYPVEAKKYNKALRKCGQYWFRETPLHHLKAGYHTALGVACKWYGSYIEKCLEQGIEPTQTYQDELKTFASFSMSMLHRTDKYLWDSAASVDLEAIVEDSFLLVHEKKIDTIEPISLPDKAARLGCPALRAKKSDESLYSPFDGVILWVEKVFHSYLL
jgi:hypothetical protein